MRGVRTEQFVAGSVHAGAAHGPLGQHAAHVVVGTHLAAPLHVHGALQRDAEPAAATHHHAYNDLHVVAYIRLFLLPEEEGQKQTLMQFFMRIYFLFCVLYTVKTEKKVISW